MAASTLCWTGIVAACTALQRCRAVRGAPCCSAVDAAPTTSPPSSSSSQRCSLPLLMLCRLPMLNASTSRGFATCVWLLCCKLHVHLLLKHKTCLVQGCYIKSHAVLRIAWRLNIPWPLLSALAYPIPGFVRDAVYDQVCIAGVHTSGLVHSWPYQLAPAALLCSCVLSRVHGYHRQPRLRIVTHGGYRYLSSGYPS